MTVDQSVSTANTKGRPLSFVFAFGLTVAAVGVSSAIFLRLLGAAASFRESHLALVYALPFAGIALAWVCAKFAGDALRGVAAVVSAHRSEQRIPRRLAPLILLGTVWTHLFGGSAGREGTAVQMGASLADGIARAAGMHPNQRAILLRVGVAAGFGAVFGTPLAGAVFSLEWVAGARRLRGVGWCVAAAFAGDALARLCGAYHMHYPEPAAYVLHVMDAARFVALGIAMAGFGRVFLALASWTKNLFSKIANPMLRSAAGGLIVVSIWRVSKCDDLLGLSLQTLQQAFVEKSGVYAPLVLKLVLTTVTLGAGFLGGEVTPLFVMGALLGRSVGDLAGVPFELGASIGVSALFAVCARVPWTGLFLAYELFGPNVVLPSALAIAVGWRLFGKGGLYGH